MTTSELKQQIEKVLGNSIRCLLPSYWWKRLFHQVADRIEEVEKKVDDIVIPTPTSASSVFFIAPLTEGGELSAESKSKNAASYRKVVNGFAKNEFYDVKIHYVFVVIDADVISNPVFTDSVLKLMYKYNSATLILSVSADGSATLEETEGGEESSSNSLFFYAPTDANTEISDVEKQHNAESYLKIAEGFETDKYYDVKVLMSTSQLVTFDAIQILNPAIDDGKLKLLFRWVSDGREQILTVTSDGSATIEDVGTSTIDTEMSDTSTNPVQNKAIKSYVDASSANVKAYTDAEVAKKVDKVEGKQLSTEDFTTALKTKLEGLSNYDDTEISNAVARLRDDFDSLTQEDISAAIENFNEIISFLDGIEDSESLDSIIASIEQQIANKQDKIEDLETIRSGAALGSTALQEHQDISHLATKEEVTNLQNEVIANEEVTAAALNELNKRVVTPYEYYKGKGGVVSESAYNIMTKYLFTPFIISNNSTTTIPDELLNESQTSFFTDYYWNFMRLTGGEPIRTTQWANNAPQKFVGISSGLSFVIDFSNKTITPEQ